MKWIDSTDLNTWANLPQLVRKLIRTTSSSIKNIKFPAGENVLIMVGMEFLKLLKKRSICQPEFRSGSLVLTNIFKAKPQNDQALMILLCRTLSPSARKSRAALIKAYTILAQNLFYAFDEF